MIPSVVVPKLLSLKNRWRSGVSLKSQFGRDLVLGSFSILVMFSIYFGLTVVLNKAQANSGVAYFHPSNILDILLLFLYGLLFFSSAVSALGLLYLSDDMPLILSAPVSNRRIFFGKLLEVTASSTWMVLVFGLPGLIAFSRSFGGDGWYYLTSVICLVPYFLIPPTICIALVTIFASVVPANRTREIIIIAGLIVVVAGYFSLRLLSGPDGAPTDSFQDLLHLINLIKIPDTVWLPTHWAAVIMGEALRPTGIQTAPYLIGLLSLTVCLISLSYTVFDNLFRRAFSMAQSNGGNVKLTKLADFGTFPLVSLLYNQQERAILGKEVSAFLRDMTQSVQLILLLGLCSLYLYNLRILRVVDQLPEATKIWWQGFLTIGNMAMGAFVIAAICTRFVFPSISLEGRAYWVLRSSPMPLFSILRSKFKIWYFPVSLIGSVLLLSGAFAIQAPIHIVIVSGIISWVVCIGIVALAVGLGAVYANFDWEHPSQLAASFGSLVYMISSTILIGINLTPVTLILLIRNMRGVNFPISDFSWYSFLGSCLLFLLYFNYLTAKWALRIGENSLLQREQQ